VIRLNVVKKKTQAYALMALSSNEVFVQFDVNDASMNVVVHSNICLCLPDPSPSIHSSTITMDNYCSPALPTAVYVSMVGDSSLWLGII